MKDPRIETLAKNLINYSIRLQKGEKVLIENFGLQKELVTALVKETYAAGGFIRFIKRSSSRPLFIDGCNRRTLRANRCL